MHALISTPLGPPLLHPANIGLHLFPAGGIGFHSLHPGLHIAVVHFPRLDLPAPIAGRRRPVIQLLSQLQKNRS